MNPLRPNRQRYGGWQTPTKLDAINIGRLYGGVSGASNAARSAGMPDPLSAPAAGGIVNGMRPRAAKRDLALSTEADAFDEPPMAGGVANGSGLSTESDAFAEPAMKDTAANAQQRWMAQGGSERTWNAASAARGRRPAIDARARMSPQNRSPAPVVFGPLRGGGKSQMGLPY